MDRVACRHKCFPRRDLNIHVLVEHWLEASVINANISIDPMFPSFVKTMFYL